MAFFFKIGAIYHVSYSRWKTNPDHIYIFILFGTPVIDKVHALNLGARQLTTLDKAKIVHTIARLSKVPTASKYSGQVLYRIMLTYLRPQVAKCYRTYFHQFVTRASIINYGLNKKEDFTAEDLKVYNPMMYQQARKDFLVRLMNMYTLRGFDVKDMQAGLAKINAKIPDQTGTATPLKPGESQTPVAPTPPSWAQPKEPIEEKTQPTGKETPNTEETTAHTTEEKGKEGEGGVVDNTKGDKDFEGTGYE